MSIGARALRIFLTRLRSLITSSKELPSKLVSSLSTDSMAAMAGLGWLILSLEAGVDAGVMISVGVKQSSSRMK